MLGVVLRQATASPPAGRHDTLAAAAAVLAIELNDVWHLACVRQAEGIALKSTGIDDLSAAPARFEESPQPGRRR
jgi:hypothetical protein